MDNLLSYCGLVGARISTSEKDLPVLLFIFTNVIWTDRNFTHRPYYFLHEAIFTNETWKIG